MFVWFGFGVFLIVIIFSARKCHFSSHCYVSIYLTYLTQRLCKRGAMLSVCLKKIKNTAATSLSKVLPPRLSPEFQMYLQSCRGKESQHGSTVTEHQYLVFAELLSSHPRKLLLIPCVSARPECSGCLVTGLRHDRPVTAGSDKHWALL